MITFTSLAADRQIGANCYVVDFDDCKVVLDAGTHPKREGRENLPRLRNLPFDSVDAVFLSHAHLDHSGALPVVLREQPSARVFMSEPTRSLADALLHNSVNVMTAKRDELGLAEYPLYTHREVERQFERWEPVPFHSPFSFSPRFPGTAEFSPAGHILGAASICFRVEGKSLLYTGDLHFEDQTLTQAASLPSDPVDTLVVETTRGASPRPPGYTRAREIQRLADAINETIEARGVVLIPVFAMGKTQELLLILHELKQSRTIPDVPVHIGGLSTKMTAIYDSLSHRARRHYAGFEILREIRLQTRPRRQRNRDLPYNPGSIYALSSGMMTENTVSNAFAQRVIGDPRSSILFVGYADPDSPAGRILATQPGDPVTLNPNAGPRPLRCRVEKFDFSGHATREDIAEYIARVRPRTVILVHGDTDALEWFQARVAADLPEARIIVPDPETSYQLS